MRIYMQWLSCNEQQPNSVIMVQLVSGVNPRQRHGVPKPCVPVPQEQRAQRQERNQQRNADMDGAMLAWESYTLSKAEELADRFDKTPRYFLDLFFQAGTRLASRHEKVNGFNAFKSKRMAEMRAGMSSIITVVNFV